MAVFLHLMLEDITVGEEVLHGEIHLMVLVVAQHILQPKRAY